MQRDQGSDGTAHLADKALSSTEPRLGEKIGYGIGDFGFNLYWANISAFLLIFYTDVMGRPADPSGVAFWTEQLDSRKRSRGSVMVGFSESNEYRVKQRENTDVAVAYVFLLGRAPKADEAAMWVARQRAGVGHDVLVGEVLALPEYAAHHGL